MIGEIGGTRKSAPPPGSSEHFTKPVVGFIAGRTAPPGKRMGHAGAIISGGKGTAADKVAAMEAAGIRMSPNPSEMGRTLATLL
jgi:succinyl-CoA synthetase alpha subunit